MRILTLGLALATAGSIAAAQDREQESGVIGAPPPQDLMLEVTQGPNGEPMLSQDEFVIALGGYYRLNFVCPDPDIDDSTGFHFEAEELVANSHLRVVSVGDIELYMQGLSFRAIECDETGAARFSFHPMRDGVYEIYVRDHSDPPQEAFGRVVVE